MVENDAFKFIHYFWFGGKLKPESVLKCIESWKKFFPSYEIKEWNEKNFDVNQCEFSREAYKQKKWAFVADYARIKILYNYGGLYFDTDVEVVKDMEDIIAEGPYMAFENEEFLSPGLGLYAKKQMPVYKEVIDYYESISFDADIRCDQYVIGKIVTKIMTAHGLELKQEIQKVDGIWVYPTDYFAPIDFFTGEMKMTENTRTIHHYDATWFTEKELKWHKIEAKIGSKVGRERIKKIMGNIVWRAVAYAYKYGIMSAVFRIFRHD